MARILKVKLYAAIRRDLRAGVAKLEIQRRYKIGQTTIPCQPSEQVAEHTGRGASVITHESAVRRHNQDLEFR
ncbi:hypothetical protein ACQPZ2_19080 [Nocardia pseudovaccinii]|uniref:hypothetical protein n=1 Tax=Nocardia pseudovaccinii TaxID=189540 RepID=UPI003D9464A0